MSERDRWLFARPDVIDLRRERLKRYYAARMDDVLLDHFRKQLEAALANYAEALERAGSLPDV